ncbi:hypothetical protein P5673_001902 [Acropora cervicornis]|uniref:Uncharacterized protein n=1 Tax=Acropora cervicornis TaxID=6130 RepID=A0AAD9R4D4_ACRCE|nr:hypothetical protein P5673_001902 [Acropora cervicornis]
MAIIYQGIILLFVFSLASAQTSPPNPECRGMNTAARHLQTGIKLIPSPQKSAKCNPNKQCSGVTCKWSSKSSGLLEVDLQYCRHPVKYHVLFKDSDLNIDRNFTIGENHKETLYRFNASVDHYKPCTYTPPPTTFISSRPHPHYPGNGPSSDPLAQGYSRKGKDKSSKDLSTGAIIGICAAGLFVILIVIGAAVYWKKYHRRL